MECRSLQEERQMDARIAQHVMGLRVEWIDQAPYGLTDSDEQAHEDNHLPAYSTSLGAAMTVALQLRRLGYEVSLRMNQAGTSIAVSSPEQGELARYDNIITKLAHYICQAALVAVGTERRKGADRREAPAA